MKACPTLTKVDLRMNRISLQGRKQLYKLVQGTSSIKDLLVKPQKDDDGEDDEEDELVMGKPKKTAFDFENVKSGKIIELLNLRETLDMTLVCELLGENIHCILFNASRNKVGDDGASEFAYSFLKW